MLISVLNYVLKTLPCQLSRLVEAARVNVDLCLELGHKTLTCQVSSLSEDTYISRGSQTTADLCSTWYPKTFHAGVHIYSLGLEKKFVSCKGPKKNRVGRSVKKDLGGRDLPRQPPGSHFDSQTQDFWENDTQLYFARFSVFVCVQGNISKVSLLEDNRYIIKWHREAHFVLLSQYIRLLWSFL